MGFENKTLTCSDCNNSFTFTAEEQEQFQQRGYTNEPKRCPDCRQARKATRNNDSNSNNRGSSYSSNRFSNSYSSRQSFPATCSACGKATTVPFEPKQGKPVYCGDCYRKVKPSR
jgi:CxxC-x17-CxxC domain-containing protein